MRNIHMKKRFSEHPLLCFILIGLLLPAISIFIVVVDELMPQSLNENPFLFGVSFIHTFGITNLILNSLSQLSDSLPYNSCAEGNKMGN